MKTWLKGGLIGVGIWIILAVVFLFPGVNYDCGIPDISGPCLSPFQYNLKEITDYVGFPLSLTSYAPGFNIWNIVFFFLWGSIIGLIYSKVKKK